MESILITRAHATTRLLPGTSRSHYHVGLHTVCSWRVRPHYAGKSRSPMHLSLRSAWPWNRNARFSASPVAYYQRHCRLPCWDAILPKEGERHVCFATNSYPKCLSGDLVSNESELLDWTVCLAMAGCSFEV